MRSSCARARVSRARGQGGGARGEQIGTRRACMEQEDGSGQSRRSGWGCGRLFLLSVWDGPPELIWWSGLYLCAAGRRRSTRSSPGAGTASRARGKRYASDVRAAPRECRGPCALISWGRWRACSTASGTRKAHPGQIRWCRCACPGEGAKPVPPFRATPAGDAATAPFPPGGADRGVGSNPAPLDPNHAA